MLFHNDHATCYMTVMKPLRLMFCGMALTNTIQLEYAAFIHYLEHNLRVTTMCLWVFYYIEFEWDILLVIY